MRSPKVLILLAKLMKKPFFTSREARENGVHPAALSHYVKNGRLKRMRRGVYQSGDYQNPLAFQWEDLIAAVYSVQGGVICLISALAVYHLTEEIPRKHWIAIRHGTSSKAVPGVKIVRYRDVELGKTEVRTSSQSEELDEQEQPRGLPGLATLSICQGCMRADGHERLKGAVS